MSSFFSSKPHLHLRKIRRRVFGFGQSSAAGRRVEYSRGAETVRIIAEPCALPEGVLEEVAFYAHGWLVERATMGGLFPPLPNDVVKVGGQKWMVFDVHGVCFSRRSFGNDIVLYTKLVDDA